MHLSTRNKALPANFLGALLLAKAIVWFGVAAGWPQAGALPLAKPNGCK